MSYSYPDHARMLAEFENLFAGSRYVHRNQTLGNQVAARLIEDLIHLGRSRKLVERAASGQWVLSHDLPPVGRRSRRGDGVFGELVPGAVAITQDGWDIARGRVATTELGVEAKVLAKSMMKQIGRVGSDLERQAEEFRAGGGNPICVGLVGVNHAARYINYERERSYPTQGRSGEPHPIQEAAKAIERLAGAATAFDEFLILQFEATNEDPYPFSWVDLPTTLSLYGAALIRVSNLYDRRFP